MKKIILDTDIGTNVDDLLALILALYSPEIEIAGITTAYGDTAVRANIAYQVIKAKDENLSIPIAPGNPKSINSRSAKKDNSSIWMHRVNSNFKLDSDFLSSQNAVELILQFVSDFPEEMTICSIAPLTNIAEAFQKAPKIMKKVKEIYIMGGVFGVEDKQLMMPITEHNMRCDPEAARIVFNSGVPITLFPLDVTYKVPFTSYDVQVIQNAKDPLHRFLYNEICSWFDFLEREMNEEHSDLHDPLTLASLIDPTIIIRSVQTSILVETSGKFSRGATFSHHMGNNNVSVVIEADISRFFELFFNRIIDTAKL